MRPICIHFTYVYNSFNALHIKRYNALHTKAKITSRNICHIKAGFSAMHKHSAKHNDSINIWLAV